GFLMMSHMSSAADLAGQARLMESYGAQSVYVAVSGGRLTMDGMRERIRASRDVLEPATQIGVRVHVGLTVRCEQRRGGRRWSASWQCTGSARRALVALLQRDSE